MTSLIAALINLIEYKKRLVEKNITSLTLAIALGDSFQNYIKDAFAGTFDTSKEKKLVIHNRVYSWQGNQNNPPDLILKGGDAIEVKKTESRSTLALNSSYPKNKISYNSFGVTKDCSKCEGENNKWVKDLIYICGVVKNKQVKSIFFLYGDIYAAHREIYVTLHDKIKDGINSIGGVELARTRELGKVKRVDPLGITDFRMRGMWSIQHPLKVFNYLDQVTPKDDEPITAYALMSKEKYLGFDKHETQRLEKYSEANFYDKFVKDPNNPANLIDAILIKIHF